MCGIAGILKVWPADQRDRALQTPHVHAIPEAWLDILDDSIKHRGPDGQGRFRDRAVRADGCVVDVAFVHRRLSIIDHAGGHQPMLSLGKGQGVVTGVRRYALGDGLGLYEQDAASELLGAHAGTLGALSAGEGQEAARSASERHQRARSASEGSSTSDRVCVIFNGCIYNHRELRAELERAGHVFSTDHSDTEVLVHGWREWGVGKNVQSEHLKLRADTLFGRLHDMFSIAVWDARTARLTLARDRFGQKPLHVQEHATAGLWAFSSEMPGLIRWGQCVRAEGITLDQNELPRWIRYGCELHAPIQNTSALPVSTLLEVGSSEPEWYESKECFSRFWVGPFGDIGVPRSGALSASEIERALSDAVAARLEADVPVGCFLSGGVDSSLIALFAIRAVSSLRTFCVRMPQHVLDESLVAAEVAKRIGTRHTTLDCSASPASDLITLVQQMGVPFGDSSALPTLWVSRATRNEVAVALAGDGGDELFGGYERYKAAQLLGRWRWLLAVLPAWPDEHPRSQRSRVARLTDAARHGGYRDLVSIFPVSSMAKLVPGLNRRALGINPYTAAVDAGSAMDDDLDHYLPNDLLRKTDSASMSVALEVRCPFLAPQVAGPASESLASSLMPHGQRKGLLRQVARKYLPADIVDRPKMGFAIPIGEWFRSDYGGLRTMLLDHLNSSEPFGSPSLGIDLNMTFVRQMLDEHLGTGPSGRVVRDHSQRLYMLLVLSIWAKWLSGLQKDPAAAPN